MKLKKILLYSFLTLGILAIVPILWSSGLEINRSEFTSEWYKEISGYFKLLLGFLLINIFWEKYKTSEEKLKSTEEYHNLIREWRNQAAIVGYAISNIKDAISTTNKQKFLENKKQLRIEYRKLSAISYSIRQTEKIFKINPTDNIFPLILKMDEYSNFFESFFDLVERGEITQGKKLNTSDIYLINKMEEFLSIRE